MSGLFMLTSAAASEQLVPDPRPIVGKNQSVELSSANCGEAGGTQEETRLALIEAGHTRQRSSVVIFLLLKRYNKEVH